MGGKSASKVAYFEKLEKLLEEYSKIFIIHVDNVSSQQMHEVRISLRGEAVILMGKNTMIRRALKGLIPAHPEYENLLPFVRENIGFVFTNGDLKEVREKILSNRVAAPARAGAVAPDDVIIEAHNTGMEPGKTSFFQTLGIPTKIARGTIEISSDVTLVTKGNKVGPSEATLLNVLNRSPFTYGLVVNQIYDNGQTYESEVLDIEESQLLKQFSSCISTITCISLAIGYPTLPSVFHSLMAGYKNLLSVAVETEFGWEGVEDLKDRIQNPDKYASSAPAAGSAAPAAAAAAPAAAAAEESEEDSDDMGDFGLFD